MEVRMDAYGGLLIYSAGSVAVTMTKIMSQSVYETWEGASVLTLHYGYCGYGCFIAISYALDRLLLEACSCTPR